LSDEKISGAAETEREELTRVLWDAALIQFGHFVRDGQVFPFQLHLDMLPSYPTGLFRIVNQTQTIIHQNINSRLLSTHDAIPFGVALSLQMGIPVVYSKGSQQPAVHDLVGAYDLAHPTTLITNILENPNSLTHLIHNARRVGLEVQSIVAILDLETTISTKGIEGVETYSLLRLSEVVQQLNREGLIPEGQAHTVREWILKQQSEKSQR
jgi:orotate phosphoribosyltransferase